MKQLLLLFGLLFISTFTFAQTDQFIGKWVFETIPESADMDDKGRAMGMKFFKDMSVNLTKTNYTLSMMGGEENGTWALVEGDTYEFISTRSTQSKITMKKISDIQLLFSLAGKGNMQLIKSEEDASVTVEEKRIDKVDGLIIDEDALSGQWFDNGTVVADDAEEFMKKLGAIRIKHNDSEYVSITFNKDGSLIKKASMEEVVNTTWQIADDKRTLSIKAGEYTKYFKVVKLDEKELFLCNPLTDKINKYVKE